MPGKLHSLQETTEMIAEGRRLLIAGDQALLDRLPDGSWIAGTIPYFIGPEGGVVSRERLYVDELPTVVTDVRIASYGPDELASIPVGGFENGFSVVILPAASEAHLRYAREATEYPGLFHQPIVGWVAGVHLDDLGNTRARAYAGSRTTGSDSRAVVLHAELPGGVLASADIVNLFRQGDGDSLTFEATGFNQGKVRVNGESQVFADYLHRIGHDSRLPLVADYFGAMINVSFQDVPDDGGPVALYAPVFSEVEYKLAAPVGDYESEFAALLPTGSAKPAFACNCILNFLYSEREGKKTGDISGPITFGEVAYQLLNQTMVYLTVHE